MSKRVADRADPRVDIGVALDLPRRPTWWPLDVWKRGRRQESSFVGESCLEFAEDVGDQVPPL